MKQLNQLTDRYHAIDTEAMNFDIKKTVVGQQIKVICASIYCGPDIDFGNGPRIWIDNLGACEGILEEFKVTVTKNLENNEIFEGIF